MNLACRQDSQPRQFTDRPAVFDRTDNLNQGTNAGVVLVTCGETEVERFVTYGKEIQSRLVAGESQANPSLGLTTADEGNQPNTSGLAKQRCQDMLRGIATGDNKRTRDIGLADQMQQTITPDSISRDDTCPKGFTGIIESSIPDPSVPELTVIPDGIPCPDRLRTMFVNSK